MLTRRKRGYSVVVASVDEPNDDDGAVIDEELAQDVPTVVDSTSPDESATAAVIDNGDEDVIDDISFLQVAAKKVLLVCLLPFPSPTYRSLMMQRIDNAVHDVRENGYSTHRSSRKHNVTRRRLTL